MAPVNAPGSALPSTLPPLAPLKAIERHLTGPEYYHASVGTHPDTQVPAREVVAVLEGEQSGDAPIDWQAALDQVVAINPGCRLRLVGKRQHAAWRSDGLPTRLRLLPDCDWDGRSSEGDAFIYTEPLSLTAGPATELIVIGRQRPKLIFRAHHAVMDGMGVAHVYMELMRALRGEPLLGSNASFTDVELMRHIPSRNHRRQAAEPLGLTGTYAAVPPGGHWQRMTLSGPQPHLIPRIAKIIADYARRERPGDVRIALPINLKRHAPKLLTTTNFTSMMYLDIAPEATLDSIKSMLEKKLANNHDTRYSCIIEAIRWLPLPWLDRLLSPHKRSSSTPKLRETAVLSVVGPMKRSLFSGGAFRAYTLYGLPQRENCFIAVIGFQGKFEVLVGMAHGLASDGRLQAFCHHLEAELQPIGEASASMMVPESRCQ